MQRKGIVAAAVAVLAGGAVLGTAAAAQAKTTVELTVNHRVVQAGHSVTFTGLATTDPNSAPHDLRLCLQRLASSGRYVGIGRCIKVTRVSGAVDVFVIKTVLYKRGHDTFRALAITPSGRAWTSPSSPVTITVR